LPGRRLPVPLEVARLRQELDRLLAEAAELELATTGEAAFVPAVDVIETPETVRLEFDLPGVAAADVALEVDGDELVLSGTRRHLAPGPGASFHALESPRGKFSRRLHVAWLVNTHRGRARLAAGVLTIEFPKIAEQRRRPLSIRIESDEP
jgi:HSP20 family protein